MLIRRRFDTAATVRKCRQQWPEYHFVGQDVMLDPWEEDDCAALVARAFSVGGVDELKMGLWITVSFSTPLGPDEQRPVRIAEDPGAGYVYCRRPIDIERQIQWNKDKNFRVTAEQW
jgi:hypothetical protein